MRTTAVEGFTMPTPARIVTVNRGPVTDVPPGYVDGMPAEEYHAHPSLSSSGARSLLRSPARYRWERDHPQTPSRDMILGTCVHTEVLGAGQGYAVLPGDDLRVKETRDAAAVFDDAGLIAIKPSEYAAVRGMAAAVRAHPLAGPLLDLEYGVAERALFWRDEASGVDCRGMVDYSPADRRCLVDLKTTADANPARLGRHMARYLLGVQAAWYLRGARALDLAGPDTEFVWVFVEREPPHLVSVVRLAAVDLAWCDELAAEAVGRFRDCTAADVWPGYPTDVVTVSLPAWSRRDYDEEDIAW